MIFLCYNLAKNIFIEVIIFVHLQTEASLCSSKALKLSLHTVY